MDLLKINNNRLWNKHGVLLMWGLAGFLLFLSISRIAWTSYSQAKIKRINYQAQEIKPLAVNNRPLYRVNDIVSANLFGDPTPKVVVKQAPVTTLNLTLQGILSATDQSQARAIIQSGKRASELYSVGEDIKGAGASVKEIRPNEVLLDRNGATESLPLKKKTGSGNRAIISYDDQPSSDLASTPASNQPSTITSNSPRQTNKRTPRKLKKPNLSRLDQALKKMGEI
jgi:type II secretion system protein C